MMRVNKWKKMALGVLALAALLCLCAPMSFAAAEGEAGVAAQLDVKGNDLRTAALAFCAALTIVGAGFATARVQSVVGAAGTGAIAEKPETFTSVLVLFAIPETIVILGFVIAILIVNQI